MPLREWLNRGAFQVTSCTRSSVAIETAGAEIGAALLSDTEYLLDHASEQRATVYDVLTRADWW